MEHRGYRCLLSIPTLFDKNSKSARLFAEKAMDELDDEQIREIEEKLYSQIHHSSLPTTLSEENVIQEEEGVNENIKRFQVKRYWKGRNEDYSFDTSTATAIATAAATEESKVDKVKLEAQKDSKKVRNPFARQQQQQYGQKRQKIAYQNMKKNPWGEAGSGGPFVRQQEQLHRAVQYENKKQKSKNARTTMAKLPNKVTETIVLDSSDDNDEEEEVVLVPMTPDPIFNVDDSDEDDEMMAKKSSDNDAFLTPKSKKLSSNSATMSVDNVSRCNSPNSVASQDDFIRQSDRQRLLKGGTIADDSDLLILTNNTDSLLEPPSPPIMKGLQQNVESSKEIECIGTFIKPSASWYGSSPAQTKSHKKNSYCVDQSGLQAMDVYESESDIVSDGVYSKGMQKSKKLNTTTIRNIDSGSGTEIDVASTPISLKKKRLRKRRASESFKNSESNMQSSSEDLSHNDDNDDDEDDEDGGVVATGIPYISRGPAVEKRKSKKLRMRNASIQGNQSDSEFMATLNSLAQGGNEQADDSETENLPSARDIAETVINQEQASTSNTVMEAVPADIGDKVEKLFNKINEFKNAKRQRELNAADDDSDDDGVCEVKVEPSTTPDPMCNVTLPECRELLNQAGEDETDEEAVGEEENGEKIKYFISYASTSMHGGIGWNEEMRRFYNNSWGGESIRVEDTLKHMNRDKRLWRILDKDRILTYSRGNKRDKCINCYSFGHTRARCPKPRKPIMCYMCGESGHLESRCPDTRCLRCGSKTTVFSQSCRKCMYWNNRICPICNLRGHSLNDCPDKWRRYHSTTKANVFPDAKVVYNKRRYCCHCGRRGHLIDTCKKALYRAEYPMTSCEIKSFEKSYEDSPRRRVMQSQVPCRLLYDPHAPINFQLAAKTRYTDMYGRFLSAVGLGYLIGENKGSRVTLNTAGPILNVSNEMRNELPSMQNVLSSETEKPSCSKKSPEQVPEISESTNEISSECSKMPPPPRPPSQAATVTVSTVSDKTEAPIDHDSDSNYSFSDHFEVPTTVKTEPLPEFISIKTSGPQKFEEEQSNSLNQLIQLDKSHRPQLGISAKYVEHYSEEEEENYAENPSQKLPADNNANNLPCEAKIYISNEHSMYFQSKPGQEYLSRIMVANNLRGRLNKTIVGYALFIHGLPIDQENLQRELESKFKSLSDERQKQLDVSSKVPKNVNVLIRFLQDSISQLYNNLGNASELYNELLELDKYYSKSNMKTAERIRRTLNMIFIGQAGLMDGEQHIETLLKSLDSLTKNYKGHEKTPQDLRNKINFSWRKIFSSNRNKNYSQLLISYLKIPPRLRNRMKNREIASSLLGKPQLKIKVRNETKMNLNEQTKQLQGDNELLLNVASGYNQNEEDQQSINQSRNEDNKFENERCQNLLSQIAKSPDCKDKDSKMPSMFWSRESQRFLKELIASATDNPSTLERLKRINTKANAGGLSYNDYRSVIELYNVTIKINKK